MHMVELIGKKRLGQALTAEEIRFMVEGYTKGEIPDYQMSAMMMAICFQGMNRQETAELTLSMRDSGDVLDLSDLPGIKVDKHSTGGVGDKTSIALAPLVRSVGVTVAKMSGRGLGHTGGTIDKLESFEGFHTDISLEHFIRQVKDIGIAIMGQTKELAPADKKLYALRDVTGTVEQISLIASSIMSKKLAAGADAIVLDVKTGSGAFMKTREDAEKLARAMLEIGVDAGKHMSAFITDMDEPLGNAVGNALEVKEAIDTLRGEGPADFTELVLGLGTEMVYHAGVERDREKALAMLKQAIRDGSALEQLKIFVEAQGGDGRAVYEPSLLPQASHVMEVKATESGYIRAIDCAEVGLCSQLLGGGREKLEDVIDPAVGLVLQKKKGDPVKAGDVLALMYYNDEKKAADASARLIRAYHVGAEPVARREKVILKELREG